MKPQLHWFSFLKRNRCFGILPMIRLNFLNGLTSTGVSNAEKLFRGWQTTAGTCPLPHTHTHVGGNRVLQIQFSSSSSSSAWELVRRAGSHGTARPAESAALRAAPRSVSASPAGDSEARGGMRIVGLQRGVLLSKATPLPACLGRCQRDEKLFHCSFSVSPKLIYTVKWYLNTNLC